MNMDLLQSIIEIVFKGNMVYIAPALFLVVVFTFADKIIDLVTVALDDRTGRRTGR